MQIGEAHSLFSQGKLTSLVHRLGVLSQANSFAELWELIQPHLGEKLAILQKEAKRRASFSLSTEVKILSYWDELYPSLLRQIYDPPLVLYALGNVELTRGFFTSVVGTRKASPLSLMATQRLIHLLGNESKNMGIVSGMALGIDRVATESSLDANLPTIGVLGTDVQKEYPFGNQNLFRRMKSEKKEISLFLSEFHPMEPVGKWNFPKRNRIITGMSASLFVMEAPAKSGAISSAKSALAQNREIVIFDHPSLTQNNGGRDWIADGATSLSWEDLMGEDGFSWIPVYQKPEPSLWNYPSEESETQVRKKLLGELIPLGNGWNLEKMRNSA